MKNKGYLLIAALLLVTFSVCLRQISCPHEEIVKQIVIHEDFSKDGMVESRCSKCNKVLETEMVDTHGDNHKEIVVFPSMERRRLT